MYKFTQGCSKPMTYEKSKKNYKDALNEDIFQGNLAGL